MSLLEESVEFYCKMLSNLDGESNPLEDTRLYTISYFSLKSNTDVKPEILLKHLQGNEKLSGVSADTLKSFADKKIEEINQVKYILSRIPALLV